MTGDEIVKVVERFMAAWPWDEWTDERLGLWCDALAELDRDVVAFCAEKLIRQSERPPTIAAFLAEVQSERERRRETVRALPAPQPSRQIPAKVREVLAQAFAARPIHDHHHGWRGCPTCVNYPPRSESA